MSEGRLSDKIVARRVMGRGRLVRLVILASLSISVEATAQAPLPIAVDQRVRVWSDAAGAITGRVGLVTPGTVQVVPDERDPSMVAVSAIRRVEVSRGRTSRGAGFKKGAIRGAIGAARSGDRWEQVWP
jgi:hypothetical protein